MRNFEECSDQQESLCRQQSRNCPLTTSTAVAINAKIAVSKAIADAYGVGGRCNHPVVLKVPPLQYSTVNWLAPQEDVLMLAPFCRMFP